MSLSSLQYVFEHRPILLNELKIINFEYLC